MPCITQDSASTSSSGTSLRKHFSTLPENDEITPREDYWEIGRGGCGVVFQSPGIDSIALKLFEHAPHPAEERYAAARLGRDFEQHEKIENAWRKSLLSEEQLPLVPRLLAFLPANEEARIQVKRKAIPQSNSAFWETQSQSLPEYWRPRTGNDVLFTERIPALQLPVRKYLIEKYCPRVGGLPQKVATSPKDRDCLIRPYLGRRTDKSRKIPSVFFTLRNFKLHLDQAIDKNVLGLDECEFYTEQMARALATCHWIAEVDANDVEFVIGGAPTAIHYADKFSQTPSKTSTGSRPRLWMYDFDKSNDIEEWNQEGMRKVAIAADSNDPYFPKPCGTEDVDIHLWSIFSDEYIRISHQILGSESVRAHLPSIFISEWCKLRIERVALMQSANKF